ncbi:Metallo-hydrolase/oxidoreductase [Anaeromyces robustus]|uniref:Metallo-hydrolase/oxidoreductase n=1 Tax=Anaeromyces robustus TaxID=1754192 RepID=A0A1Y1XLF8_9FUNG|nr:Metallo-hydrolase/oxidoreductase [Anaeromyces robustus]|eukprot:ORX86326.1 Metallo-hydrolase/oxidoreductase [Anaeromyces robustus]
MANTIDITFLGTSSAQPSVTRNHSSLAVRINGYTWLFDAGEGTQRQLMFSTLKLGKINKVFITHLHGDHVYGLPGLICTLTAALNPQNHNDNNNNADENEEVGNDAGIKDPKTTPCLEVYGPEGLRKYLRCALTFTYSRLPIYYRVHEFIMPKNDVESIRKDSPSFQQDYLNMRDKFSDQIKSDFLHPDELMGENIQPDDNGYYLDVLSIEQILNSNNNNNSNNQEQKKNSIKKKFKNNPIHDLMKVHATYIRHSVPTLGYVLEEHGIEGNIKLDLVQPLLLKNKEALAKQGIKQPFALIKDLKKGNIINLPDGTVLDPKDVITPVKQRKIVILGDTFNPSKIEPLAQNPTILVHEATNMYEGEEEEEKEKEITEEKNNDNNDNNNENDIINQFSSLTLSPAEQYRQKVISRGHSIPEMAGAFAKKLNAKYLILNHFSSRYSSLNHMGIIQPPWNNPNLKNELKKYCQFQNQDNKQQPLLPYPINYEKRDLLSEEEKLQLKKSSSKNKNINTITTDNSNSNSNNNDNNDNNYELSLEDQKLIKDWETMEKIRRKAASTFHPPSLNHIILADDYLQVECNREKVDTTSSSSKSKNNKNNNDEEKEKDNQTIPIYMGWNQDLI